MTVPKCGAKKRQGTGTCQQVAGWGTDHVGQGRCKLHGGNNPIKHGRYSKITRPRIRELLDELEDDDQLDLLPEVKLLRALTTDFVERYDHFVEAVHAWHASHTNDYRAAYATWREQMIRLHESGEWIDREADDLPPPPDPGDYTDGKPRQVLDITAAAGLIDKIGRMVERVERMKAEGSITLETLDRVLEQLGMEVVHALTEEAIDGATRTSLLQNIERRWGSIRVDPTTATRQGAPTSSRPIN